MNRVNSVFVVATIAIAVALSSIATVEVEAQAGRGSRLTADMDGLTWGMTRQQLLRHFSEKIEEDYRPRLAHAPGAIEEDRLRHRMNEDIAQIRESYFVFNGRTSGHDSSYLRYEFTHDNNEALMQVRAESWNDYFFFINNHLWKRYRAYHSSAFGDVNFAAFAGVLRQQYGQGQSREGKLHADEELEHSWVEWSDTGTRARAIDNSHFYGMYCLVFEEKATLARLDSLRTTPSNRGAQGHRIVDSVIREGDADANDPNTDVADRISGRNRRAQQGGN